MKSNFLLNIKSILVIFFMFCYPLGANAQDCIFLSNQENRIEREIYTHLSDYPWTNLLLGGCIIGALAAAESSSTPEGALTAASLTFGGCALIACGLSGRDNCFSVGEKWLKLSIQQALIESRKNDQGCD